jgi:hypothetical protein
MRVTGTTASGQERNAECDDEGAAAIAAAAGRRGEERECVAEDRHNLVV